MLKLSAVIVTISVLADFLIIVFFLPSIATALTSFPKAYFPWIGFSLGAVFYSLMCGLAWRDWQELPASSMVESFTFKGYTIPIDWRVMLVIGWIGAIIGLELRTLSEQPPPLAVSPDLLANIGNWSFTGFTFWLLLVFSRMGQIVLRYEGYKKGAS